MKKILIIIAASLAVSISIAFFIMNSSISGDSAVILSQQSYDDNVRPADMIEKFVKDIQNTITGKKRSPTKVNPSTSEDKAEPPKKKDPKDITIYVDAGHGGDSSKGNKDGTAVGTTITVGKYTGMLERVITFYIATRLKARLLDEGYKVQMSRDEADTTSAIGNAARGEAGAKCDFMVVIHVNAAGGPGFMLLTNPKDSRYDEKAYQAFKAAMEHHGLSPNVKPIYTKALNGPSAYIKAGGDVHNLFYVEVAAADCLPDADYVGSNAGQDEIADCLLEAVNAHFSS